MAGFVLDLLAIFGTLALADRGDLSAVLVKPIYNMLAAAFIAFVREE